jgi:accessory gene regulator protein AgrB
MTVYSNGRSLRPESFFAVPLYGSAIVANNIDNRFFFAGISLCLRNICSVCLWVCVSFTFLRFQFYCPLSNGAGKCTVLSIYTACSLDFSRSTVSIEK